MCCAEYYDCSIIDPPCTACSSRTICTQCNAPYVPQVYSNVTSQCHLCRDIMSCCASCLNSTVCLACDAPYVIAGSICTIEHRQTCINDNSTHITCTLCKSGYNLVTGGCTDIAGCISIVPGSQICLACEIGAYNPTPVNNACSCLVGKLINGICSSIPGCITPYVENNAIVCLYCNCTLNFENFPNNGECRCRNGYHLVD